jgi:hypothetical protein
MVEMEIGRGEFFSLGSADQPRAFTLFEIAANTVEARFSDGSAPLTAKVRRLASEEVAEALSLAAQRNVMLDCGALLFPAR